MQISIFCLGYNKGNKGYKKGDSISHMYRSLDFQKKCDRNILVISSIIRVSKILKTYKKLLKIYNKSFNLNKNNLGIAYHKLFIVTLQFCPCSMKAAKDSTHKRIYLCYYKTSFTQTSSRLDLVQRMQLPTLAPEYKLQKVFALLHYV